MPPPEHHTLKIQRALLATVAPPDPMRAVMEKHKRTMETGDVLRTLGFLRLATKVRN